MRNRLLSILCLVVFFVTGCGEAEILDLKKQLKEEQKIKSELVQKLKAANELVSNLKEKLNEESKKEKSKQNEIMLTFICDYAIRVCPDSIREEGDKLIKSGNMPDTEDLFPLILMKLSLLGAIFGFLACILFFVIPYAVRFAIEISGVWKKFKEAKTLIANVMDKCQQLKNDAVADSADKVKLLEDEILDKQKFFKTIMQNIENSKTKQNALKVQFEEASHQLSEVLAQNEKAREDARMLKAARDAI